MSKKTAYLLPSSVVPEGYYVHLKPDFEKFTFEGLVAINVNVVEPTREITLHAAELTMEAEGAFFMPARGDNL